MNLQAVRKLHEQAHIAGMKAGNECAPTPMIVAGSGGYREYVSDGVCGFAWVKFKGNTSFGRGMKKLGLARPAYPTGLSVWVSEFDQSMQRKEAYARAYAAVLRDAGITDASAGSRMD